MPPDDELLRLLVAERRRQRQLTAGADIRLKLLGDAPIDDVFDLACRHAGDLLDASSAVLALREAEGIVVVGEWGDGGARARGVLPASGSVAARTMDAGAAVCLDGDLGGDGGPPRRSRGPVVGAPISSQGRPCGALLAARTADEVPFGPDDVDVLQGLADQASLALELARARDDREALLLAHDRERIARDLHDVVIQRLFAAGMALEALLGLVDGSGEGVAVRVTGVVDQLDEAVRGIRSAIFQLAPPHGSSEDLRAALMRVAGEASGALGFSPRVRFVGAVDTAVPEDVAVEVLVVAREALSNVARHASASRVDVELSAGERVVLTVDDDGIGFHPGARASGTANMGHRADGLGGDMRIGAGPAGGTRLRWSVPTAGAAGRR